MSGQTLTFICKYLYIDIAKIVISYVGHDTEQSVFITCYQCDNFNFQMRHITNALYGYYEKCLDINVDIGLTSAITGKYEHIVTLMINRGACVESVHVECACQYDSVEVLEILIPNVQNLDVHKCIFNACQYGSDDVLRYILDNCKNQKLDKCLTFVCEKNLINKADILLSQNISQYSNYFETLQCELHNACRLGYLDLVKLIHTHTRQHNHQFDWEYAFYTASEANTLQYALLFCTRYNHLFECIMHGYKTFPHERTHIVAHIKLLLPHVSAKHCNQYMNLPNSDPVRKLIFSELFIRACRRY